MAKKKEASVKKVEYKTKEDLVGLMNDMLSLQIEIVEKLKAEYERVESGDIRPEDNKYKNPYHNALNNQIDALNRTTSALIRVYGSKIEEKVDEQTEEEQPKKEKPRELVD